jgi:class 3 adenylate cyclase
VSQFLPETCYVEVGGARVGYQVVGDGPIDLVFALGLGHQIDLVWDLAPAAALIQDLASISRYIVFDRRGTGVSDPISRDSAPTWEDWAEDVRAVLDAVGSRRAAVMAALDTGQMAILFAAMQPDRVSKLVLVNTAARGLQDDDYPIGTSAADADAVNAFVEQAWGTSEMARTMMPSRADDEEFLRLAARMTRASASPRSAAAQADYITRHVDVREVLPLIQAPTLVIHSKDLSFVPVERGRYLAEHIPGAKLVELPGSDLIPYDQLFDEIAEFLTGERPMVTFDRILATVLFTDIVASTEQLAARGDDAWRRTMDDHDRTMERIVAAHRGRIVKPTGDGILATFDGPARAVRCAAEMLDAAAQQGITLRAGLHTGEIEIRPTDVTGIAVHTANRISALAEPGEIRVSRTVVDLTAGSGLQFQPRGEHQLKGVPGTWPTFAATASS